MQHPRRSSALLSAALALAPLGALGASPAAVPPEAGIAPPRILSAAITPDPIHPGGHVEADVVASPNVAAVEAHVHGMTFRLDEVRPGEFRLERTVPKIARFFKGTYHVTFVARCTGGQTTERAEDVVLD